MEPAISDLEAVAPDMVDILVRSGCLTILYFSLPMAYMLSLFS